MKTAEYIQSDDFSTMEMGDKIDYLSKQSPKFKALPLAQQREYVMTKTKQPSYKSRDLVSKISRFAVPLAGQLGGEALAGAAALPTGPGALAAAMAGGGAGATLGETGVDFMDYARGMGPKPSFKSEMKEAPSRFAFGSVGSGLGKGMVKLVNPKTMEGAMEAVGNPRLYTRAIPQIEKGMGTEAAVEKAAKEGSESVAKYEADAVQKIKKVSDDMGSHWKEKGYKDSVRDFQTKEPSVVEFQKKYGKDWFAQYEKAYKDYSKGMNLGVELPGKGIKSIVNRFLKTVREKGKTPVEEEVPELVRTKRLAQSKLDFDPYETNSRNKLSPDEKRWLGRVTNETDERITQLDPQWKKLELRHAQASKELEKIQASSTVKDFGGRKTPNEFAGEFSKVARTKPVRGSTPGGETDLRGLKEAESSSGVPFTDKLMNNLSAEHFKRLLAENSSMWQKRMGIAAPLVLGSAAASGKVPPAYLSAMSVLAMMLSPMLARQLITNVPRFGMQALSQGMRQAKEPERE